MKHYSSNKQYPAVVILIQFFSLLLLSAWMSVAHARAMEVTISATPDPAVAGEELIYTVAYRNAGSACPQARLHFTLPQHVGAASGTTQSWFLRTLPGGRHGSKTVRVKVDSPLAPNTELKTTASVTSTGSVTCRTTVTDSTNVRPALQVTKTSSVGTVDVGDPLVYTLHYDNAGKGNASNVILQDTLPGDASFVSATGNHSESGNTVTWNLGTVIAGAQGSVTLTVDVDSPPANGVLTNSGTIDSTETDPSPFSLDVNVHSEPVLTLTKTASKDPVSPGDHLLYHLHYENTGTAEATNLVVRDTLPVGVSFDSAPGGSLSGNIVSWNLADLPPNHSGDLTLSVIVDSTVVNGHILENSATLDSNETQPVTALKDVVVLAEPAFEITKTASKDPVNPGDELTYTINYRNIGSGEGTGIIIEDELPPGVTFKSASGGGSESGGIVTWNLAALSAGASGSVTVTVTVNSPLANGTILLNTVSMVSTETAPHKVTDIIDVTVHSEPVLKLSKTSSKDPVNAGDELVYTITYENVGTGVASTVTLEDDLPADVTFKSASNGGSELGGKVTWNLADLSAGAHGSVTVTVDVNSPLTNGTVLHNVTTIESAETQPLSDFNDVIVSSTAALKLTKTASKTVVNPGDELVYTIAYENVGSDQASNVILEDILPAGVTFKSASSPGALAGGSVRWDLGTVAAGAAGSVTLTVTVNKPLANGIVLSNVASIISTETPHPVRDEVQVPVLSEPVLEMNKTASKTLVKPGDLVLYSIEYKNVGTGEATGVIISDTLPGNVTFVSASPGGSLSGGGVVTWPPTTVRVGEPPKGVSVAVTINSPLADGMILHNPASLVSNETAPLSSSVDITVLSEPVLELNKTTSKTQVSPGEKLIYTIEYKNVGTDVATNVVIEDRLPGEVTFISASLNGAVSSNVVSWDLGSIPSGASGAVFVSVKVNSPLTDGTILHNPASISSNETQSVSTIADVTVLSHPLLELNKTAALPHVSPGDELTYTIEYKNRGTDQATGVTLEDHIPGDVTFVSATGGGILSNGIVSWAIGTLPAGAPASSVTVKVKINDPLPNGAVIHNPASIKSTETGSITSQADVSVISAPVLELTKTASKNPVLAGDTLVYTLDYKNVGTDQATGVILEDQLPGDVTFVSASRGGTLSGSVVSWDLGSISPGGTPGSVFVTVKVNSPLANGKVLQNLASITSTEHAQASSSVDVKVDSAPVLALNKTASKTHVDPGDTLTYTIDYKNTGNDQATNVKLEDHLPSDVTFISASSGNTVSGNVVSWDLGDLPGGGTSGSVFVTVQVNTPLTDGKILHNLASIVSATTQPVLSTVEVTVYSQPVLELIKTAAQSHVNPGDNLLYTLEYKNTGTDQATGVTLEDHLPGNVTFVSATGGGTVSGGIVNWNIGTMQAGAVPGSVTLKVRINDSLPNGTLLHNTASMDSNETGPITSQADVIVDSAAVLKLTKTASKDPVLPGDTLVYTFDYKNSGTDQATSVKLEDHLPKDVTFISATGGGTESGGIVTWNLSPIPIGQTGSQTLTVKVNSPLITGTILQNTASLDSAQSQPTKAMTTVTVESTPVLELTKTASADPVAPGDTLIYTLNYSNVGNDQATGVILEDHLPTNVSFVSASDGGTVSGGIVSWDLGSIPAGTSRSVILTVLVNSALNNGIVLQNSASIISKETHSFSASTDITVGTGPALELTKTASSDPVEPGDTLVYTIEYKNVGNSPATSVILEDDLPPGVSVISSTQGGVDSGGKVIWHLGSLPAGASGSVAITVAINTSVTDGTILHNAATIDSSETHPVSTQQSVTVLGTPSLPPSTTQPIPTLGTWMKLMLSLLLFAVASYFINWRKA